MATIVVQLNTIGAGGAPPSVVDVASRYGLKLTAQFPGVNDRELASYFVAQSDSFEDAAEAAKALISLHEVDAAYLQPEASIP